MRMHQILTEATFDLDTQVDYLYDAHFRDYCESVLRDEPVNLPKVAVVATTKDLPPSDLIRKANKLQTCKIKINDGNAYVPDTALIKISVSIPAVEFLVNNDATLSQMVDRLRDTNTGLATQLETEFSASRVKGSIYHELSHWLDNVFHNQHILRKLHKASTDRIRRAHHLHPGVPDVMMSSYEIDAQIHSIKQLKRDYSHKWDDLTFDQMLSLNSTLTLLNNESRQDGFGAMWRKKLKARMAREGLLGQRMR